MDVLQASGSRVRGDELVLLLGSNSSRDRAVATDFSDNPHGQAKAELG